MSKNIFSKTWIWRSFAGWIVIYTGYLLMIMLYLGVEFWSSSQLRLGMISDVTRDVIHGGLFGVIGSFFYGWSRFVWTYGNRLMNRSAIDVLLSDYRPPVLYLRSFSTDVNRPTWRGLPFQSIEENLAGVLSSVGPVIAIGRPGEFLPQLGAYKWYVRDNEDWRNTVSFFMTKAAMVVVKVDISKGTIGINEGLKWEINRIVEIVEPQRVLIVLETRSPSKTQWSTEKKDLSLCEETVDSIHLPLPKRVDSKYFVEYDNNWNSKLLGISTWRWILGQGRANKAGIREAIRPFCMNLGYRLPWFPTIFTAIFRLSYLAFMTVSILMVVSALDLYEPLMQDIRVLFQSQELKSEHQTFGVHLPTGWGQFPKELRSKLPMTSGEDRLFACRLRLGQNGYGIFVSIERISKPQTLLNLEELSEVILPEFNKFEDFAGTFKETIGLLPAVIYRFKYQKMPYIVIVTETPKNYYCWRRLKTDQLYRSKIDQGK